VTRTAKIHGPTPARRSFGGVLLALMCSGALQAAPTSTSAETVTAAATKPSGSFLAAELPADVHHSNGVRETVVGDIEHATASAKSGDASLSITASILPGFVTAVTTDDMLYRKARNELLKVYSARSTSWRSGSHAGFTCYTLSYAADDGRKGMARLYLQDDVLVVINAVYDQDEAAARRFLASVH
jgi:hypothetical protein